MMTRGNRCCCNFFDTANLIPEQQQKIAALVSGKQANGWMPIHNDHYWLAVTKIDKQLLSIICGNFCIRRRSSISIRCWWWWSNLAKEKSPKLAIQMRRRSIWLSSRSTCFIWNFYNSSNLRSSPRVMSLGSSGEIRYIREFMTKGVDDFLKCNFQMSNKDQKQLWILAGSAFFIRAIKQQSEI